MFSQVATIRLVAIKTLFY